MTTFLTLVFIAIALLLILVVLVQRGRGGGLSGAFGSGGGSTSAFGTKTGDVFTTMTVVLFVVFMLLSIWLNMHFRDMREEIAGTAHATTEPAVTAPPGAGPVSPFDHPAATTATAPAGTVPGNLRIENGPPAPATLPAASGAAGVRPPAATTSVTPSVIPAPPATRGK